ncbi:MAG: SUMF1/EgtB/PvdO family nonheme iron enzyme, partial [Planctomycetota bacterium]|nr:SUMF1/EgtB/PvdO family nonheme iron enzyme [Planctomycetota bacterium]
MHLYCFRLSILTLALCATVTKVGFAATEDPFDGMRHAVTFYASFDENLKADYGDGSLNPRIRFDHAVNKGEYEYSDKVSGSVVQIDKQAGIVGGALHGLTAMPRRGRMFYSAKDNIDVDRGWGGSVSMWINTNPDTLLTTKFCDPIQITERRAGDGGLWVDFPDVKPRDLRMGVFRALSPGEKSVSESAVDAPLIHVKKIGFKSGDWHHVVMTWSGFDSGRPNATASLYIDGMLKGRLDKRLISMSWNLDKTGIYTAVGYIGLLDELAILNRPLSADEVKRLFGKPDAFQPLKGRKSPSRRTTQRLRDEVHRVADLGADHPEVARVRSKIHAALTTPSGRRVAEDLIRLLLELPSSGPRPPAAPEFPFDAQTADRYQKANSRWIGLPVEFTNSLGIKFRLVPPGEFVMGSPADEPGHDSPYDESQHPVRLTRPFYLAAHETTLAQFREFVTANEYVTDGERNGGGHAHDEQAVWKHRPGTSWKQPGFAGPFQSRDNMPVVHASHSDATAFCEWLNRRTTPVAKTSVHVEYGLPTEAQWEWACRAGSAHQYWWGTSVDTTGKVLNVGDRTLKAVHPKWPRDVMPMTDGHAFIAPVGSYRANAFGLHDMLGNVWEFCGTRYGTFSKTLTVNPGDLELSRGFAVRGGGWSNIPTDARCASRNADPPHFCHSNLGFRVAIQLPARVSSSPRKGR